MTRKPLSLQVAGHAVARLVLVGGQTHYRDDPARRKSSTYCFVSVPWGILFPESPCCQGSRSSTVGSAYRPRLRLPSSDLGFPCPGNCANLIIMFGIGFPELIIILIVALLVVGPSRLPEVARSIGKALGEFRRMADDVKESLTAGDETRRTSSTTRKSQPGVAVRWKKRRLGTPRCLRRPVPTSTADGRSPPRSSTTIPEPSKRMNPTPMPEGRMIEEKKPFVSHLKELRDRTPHLHPRLSASPSSSPISSKSGYSPFSCAPSSR